MFTQYFIILAIYNVGRKMDRNLNIQNATLQCNTTMFLYNFEL